MATEIKSKEEVESWSDMFPQQMTSFKESVMFMKRLLGVAICNITYLRMMFPDDAFIDKSLGGIRLKILKNDETFPQVSHLINCLKGVFEALEKKYLKELNFIIHADPEKPEIALDSFNFLFNYNCGSEVSVFNNKEKVSTMKVDDKTKEATVKLLRRLIVMSSTWDSLPQNFSLSMRLQYYEDVTPPDYEPPGFETCLDELNFKSSTKTSTIGSVSTLYHTLDLKSTICEGELENEDYASQQLISYEDYNINNNEMNNSKNTNPNSISIKNKNGNHSSKKITQNEKINLQMETNNEKLNNEYDNYNSIKSTANINNSVGSINVVDDSQFQVFKEDYSIKNKKNKKNLNNFENIESIESKRKLEIADTLEKPTKQKKMSKSNQFQMNQSIPPTSQKKRGKNSKKKSI